MRRSLSCPREHTAGVEVRRESEGERWFCEVYCAAERESFVLVPSVRQRYRRRLEDGVSLGLARHVLRLSRMSITPSQVVVGFDFSHSGRAALERSIALATRAPFHVLQFACVIDPHTPIAAVPTTEAIDFRYAELVERALTNEVETMLRAANVTERVHFSVHVRIGKPADEILSVARDVGAELIIVGTKGTTGLERWILGSVAETVVREAHCTVEVARPNTYEHVDLLKIVEVETHLTHTPPHHYSYADSSLSTLSAYWSGWY